MSIKIGKKNKIKRSIIGNENKVTTEPEGIMSKEIMVGIIVTVVGGIILAAILAMVGK